MNSNEPLPLVFHFHGFTGTAAGSKGEFPAGVAASAGDRAIFVYPQGTREASVDDNYQVDTGWYHHTSCSDSDMLYFNAIFNEIANTYCIDMNRVFLSGFSMGASMIYDIGCCQGDKIRAIAPIGNDGAATKNIPLSACTNQRPSMWMSFGSNDYRPVSELRATVSQHGSHLGCSSSSSATTPNPCREFSGCQAGKRLVSCEYPGMGHGFPDGWSTNHWNFFRSFR